MVNMVSYNIMIHDSLRSFSSSKDCKNPIGHRSYCSLWIESVVNITDSFLPLPE